MRNNGGFQNFACTAEQQELSDMEIAMQDGACESIDYGIGNSVTCANSPCSTERQIRYSHSYNAGFSREHYNR